MAHLMVQSTTEPTGKKTGVFITVEGIEGVGKTTNMAFIRDYLQSHQVALTVTREPGGTPLAEQIRGLLLTNHEETLDSDAELLLVFAARAQHLNQLIKPALATGGWVLSDRFTDATYAYQGGGRGLSQQTIAELERQVQGELRPDLTLLLDVPVAVGLSRAGQRGELDRFEREKQVFFERVRSTYLQRAAAEPERFCIVDASQPLAAVQADIETALQPFLARQGLIKSVF